MERGAAVLHFEDPSQPLAVSPSPGMWSVPVGAYADISRSKLARRGTRSWQPNAKGTGAI